MPSVKQVEKAEVIADAAREDGEVVAKPQAKKSKKYYFKNRQYSALSILIRGGEDFNGQLGVEHKARFEPFYDVWKGDVIRVGFLVTDREDVALRCREDSSCEEIDEKEYTQAVEGDSKNKPLRKAPIQKV